MAKTKIEWADAGWNAYTWNCTKVSAGCKFCYAERDAKKFNKTFAGAPVWRRGAENDLRTIAAGSVVFVNNHSDTYHENAQTADIFRIHTLCVQRPDLIFLLLTKRPEIALQRAPELAWPDNLWLGTSVEQMRYMKRIKTLKQTPAKHFFISFEPLLERLNPVDLYAALDGVDWAIVGGESGEEHRPFNHQWAEDIRLVCERRSIPFFYKQGSAVFPGSDRVLQTTGQLHEQEPAAFEQHRSKYQPTVMQSSLF